MSRSLLLSSVLLILPASVATAQPPPPEVKAVLEVCKPDIARFCKDVPPGEGRVKACMKAHLPELSEPCKEALFQAWLND
jgi:cysteine rich repeat protein